MRWLVKNPSEVNLIIFSGREDGRLAPCGPKIWGPAHWAESHAHCGPPSRSKTNKTKQKPIKRNKNPCKNKFAGPLAHWRVRSHVWSLDPYIHARAASSGTPEIKSGLSSRASTPRQPRAEVGQSVLHWKLDPCGALFGCKTFRFSAKSQCTYFLHTFSLRNRELLKIVKK